MKATYDHEANVAYVEFLPGLKSLGTDEVAPGILVDWTESGEWVPIGIELLNPKPRPRLAAIAAEHGFAHMLDDIYAVLDIVLSWRTSSNGQLGMCEAWLPSIGWEKEASCH